MKIKISIVFILIFSVSVLIGKYYIFNQHVIENNDYDSGPERIKSAVDEDPLLSRPIKTNSSENGISPEVKHALTKILNTSSEGLKEVVTENGVMVDLEGRFKTAPVAEIKDNGEIVVIDYVAPSGK